MSLLKRLLGREAEPPAEESPLVDLAFVLLAEATLPDPATIVASYSDFAPPGEALRQRVEGGEKEATREAFSFEFESGRPAFVAFLPVAVPHGEADADAQFSVSSLGTDWTLPDHSAHLIVTSPSSDSTPRIEALSRFTSLLAAVAKSTEAVGVYWGNAGATHDAKFFTSIASEQGVAPRIMLWSGISVAREKDGRLSLLSLGMQQLQLPDLLLLASPSSEDTALETFFDLLSYVAERGEALPDDDTVGRTAAEKLRVRYVRSPVDRKKRVWRIELP